MNWAVWNEIEKILLFYNVKPILAIVPDNRDSQLDVGPKDEDFFNIKIKKWIEYGWEIGVHGYQHIYNQENGGLMNFKKKSEFAGLNYLEQLSLLKKAIEVFHDNKVYPRLFIAPNHSFDKNTLKALNAIGIKIISDGFYRFPIIRNNIIWLPQQIWHIRKMPRGIWTACFHINNFSDQDIKNFKKSINDNISNIIEVSDIDLGKINKYNIFHFLFEKLFRLRRLILEKY